MHLVVEIKGHRREDAKEKKNTMDAYWVPGVNNHGNYGRWAFAEFADVWDMKSDFELKVEEHFNEMIRARLAVGETPGAGRLADGGSDPGSTDIPSL